MASVNGTLYTGITNSLQRRVHEHENNLIEGFSKQYSCHKLIYYEHYSYIHAAISREKQLKKWSRTKKENLIKIINPYWKDLYDDLF